jgi:hypothetical protein
MKWVYHVTAEARVEVVQPSVGSVGQPSATPRGHAPTGGLNRSRKAQPQAALDF